MSGIKIEESLLYFAKEIPYLKKYSTEDPPLVIKLDSKIKDVYLKDPENSEAEDTASVWRDTILELSYPKLKKYWGKAFDEVKSEVEAAVAANPKRAIFINLHSCYFHNETQEYISLIKLDKIKSLNPDMIITFIDDIYEIYHRLCQLGGIFHVNDNPNATEFILRHIRLLDWRSKETLLSRFYAENIDCKHFLFAVKHSSKTLYNLIFEKSKTVYLSHPITEVRRLQKDKKTSKQAEDIINEINDISKELTLQFTAFLPTTIDEYRINYSTSEIDRSNEKTKKKFKVQQNDYFFNLTERWDCQKYNNKNERNLIYRQSRFNDTNTFWKSERPIVIEQETSHLLAALSDIISDQVTVRDYILTEQSDFLVLYRPLFNGNPSKGVKKELEYFKKMKKDDNKDCYIFIYCPEEDTNDFYIRQFSNLLKNEMVSNQIEFDISPEEFDNYIIFDEELKYQLLAALAAKNSVKALYPIFDLAKENFKFHISESNSTRTPLGSDNYREYRKSFSKRYYDYCKEIIDFYSMGCTYFEKNKNISMSGFTNNIQKHLTTKK